MYAYVVNQTIQGIGDALNLPPQVEAYQIVGDVPCKDANDLGICRDFAYWSLNHEAKTATAVYQVPDLRATKQKLLGKLKDVRKQYEGVECAYLPEQDIMVAVDDQTMLRLSQCAIEADLVGDSWERQWKCKNGWRTLNSEILRELQIKIGQRLNALFIVEKRITDWIQEQTDVVTLLETSIQSLWESEYEKTVETPDP